MGDETGTLKSPDRTGLDLESQKKDRMSDRFFDQKYLSKHIRKLIDKSSDCSTEKQKRY